MGAGVNWDKIDNSHQDAYIFPAMVIITLLLISFPELNKHPYQQSL